MCVDQTEIKQESDNFLNHKMPMRTTTSEMSMDNQTFKHLVAEDNGMKIILEFPCSPQDDSIISEVKELLAEMLNEYLKEAS